MAQKKGSGTISLRNNKLIFAGISVLMILVFVGAFTLMKSVYETETYYVLKQAVPARTQVTPDMLEPVVTSKDTSPPTALSLEEVQAGYLYTKHPLRAGDVLTYSNVGLFENISVGVPDTWVVTTFSVDADNAVGGRIQRGVYFDMMVVQGRDEGGSFYPFINMLCLDTSVSLNSASNANAAETEEAKAGQTSQYIVALSPDDAGRLQQVMKDYSGSIKLLLSPKQNDYAAPQLASYTGAFKFEGDTPKDMGKGTDYTFTPLKRKPDGQPIEVQQNCSKGNAKLTPEECQEAGLSTTTPPATPAPTSGPSTPSSEVPPSPAPEESEAPTSEPTR